MDGLKGEIPLKWMMKWGTPIFGNHQMDAHAGLPADEHGHPIFRESQLTISHLLLRPLKLEVNPLNLKSPESPIHSDCKPFF